MDLKQQIEHFLSTNFSTVLIILIAIFLIILCVREVRCWYWKIDDRISLHNQEIAALEEIIDLQKTQIRLLESNISKMNQLIFNTAAIEEAAPTKENDPE